MGSHGAVGNADSKNVYTNGNNSGCFKLHISQNVAKFMPSHIIHLCGNFLLAVYLSKEDGAIFIPHKLSKMSDRLKKGASVKQSVERLATVHR